MVGYRCMRLHFLCSHATVGLSVTPVWLTPDTRCSCFIIATAASLLLSGTMCRASKYKSAVCWGFDGCAILEMMANAVIDLLSVLGGAIWKSGAVSKVHSATVANLLLCPRLVAS